MIDFYWLKSFSEILQFFLSVLFIIYLKIKFDQASPTISWLAVFFYAKLATDLYGILNYTSWISAILTRPVLSIYRASIGTFELGMIVSLVLFVLSFKGIKIPKRTVWTWFSLAALIFPINLILIHFFQSDLIEMFDLVKLIWIGASLYLFKIIKPKPLKIFLVSVLLWNVLWLFEVVMHQQLNLITTSTSWALFVLSELVLTIGLAYFLLQLIARPKLLLHSRPDHLPVSLKSAIASKLRQVVEVERLYVNPELSVATLAEKMDIPSADLTSYLNRVLSKNFNQYIGEFRINESMRLLEDDTMKNKTIEQIMIASGFNSKSVFNTAFKNETGLTPREYRKSSGNRN